MTLLVTTWRNQDTVGDNLKKTRHCHAQLEENKTLLVATWRKQDNVGDNLKKTRHFWKQLEENKTLSHKIWRKQDNVIHNLKKTRHCHVLSFLTLVRRCWRTLTCELPLVLSFLTLVSRCWWILAWALPLVLSLFDIGQSLLVDFGLSASTRLVFIWHWSVAVGGLWLVRFHSSCLFWHWSVAVGEFWLVRSHSSCLVAICFLQVVTNSVLFSSNCHQQCLVFF